MKKVLFVCGYNRLRSPTAEQVFSSYPEIEVDSAGLNHDANVPLTPKLVQWADMILVMEKEHLAKIRQKFKAQLKNQKLISLDIPDEYEYMDPKLVEILKKKVTPFLKGTS